MTKREMLLITSCFLLLSQATYSKEFWGEGIAWFNEKIKTIIKYKPEYEGTINLPYQTVYRNIRSSLTACVITDNFNYITGDLYTDIKSGEIYVYYSADVYTLLINIYHIESDGEDKSLVKSWARSVSTPSISPIFVAQKTEYAANHGWDADCLEFVEPVKEQKIPKL